MRYTVSPAVGSEREYEENLVEAETPKGVLVIDAGPAGMKAARTDALRGHSVTLVDKNDVLGGNIRLAMIPPDKEVREEWLDYSTARA